jgi:hypothetical protein
LLLARAGNRQMGVMHRIKAAAENAEPHVRFEAESLGARG